MNKLLFTIVILACLCFSAGFPQNAAADVPYRLIQDDSSLRASLKDSWLAETPARVQSKQAEYHTLQGGARIQVRCESGPDEFGIVFAREFKNPASAGSSWPGWAQGSWILTRKKSDGSPVRIRTFLRSDPYVYVQFRPFTAEKCQMDVVVYDAYLVRSMPLAVPFDRLLALPVNEVLALAGAMFPAKYFDSRPNMYRDTRDFIAAVRSKLPGLHYTDDGAIDENGRYVYINSLEYQNPAEPAKTGGLNCSGFAKWIVDGILKPVTGESLPINPLKQTFNGQISSFTQIWDSILDPLFGLNWIRNLAASAGEILRSPSFSALEEFEVRSWPFSQIITRQGSNTVVIPYPGFIAEAGFGIEGLQPLLYTLAINEPGRIYLAAVNDEIGQPVTADNPRGLPRIRRYYHVAVLIPYFDENNAFQVTVFESAAETSFTAFRNRYPGQFVNLVRIPIDGRFDPD
ncbi:MAG: hypothetical protein FWD78_00480 [Treponema sp.]|nr:hypothetical protein [Treponema sp.]